MQRPNSCPWSWKSPPHLGYAVVCGLIWKTLKKHLGLFLPSWPQQRQSYLSVKVSLMLWLMAVRQNKNSTASLLVCRNPEKKDGILQLKGPCRKKQQSLRRATSGWLQKSVEKLQGWQAQSAQQAESLLEESTLCFSFILLTWGILVTCGRHAGHHYGRSNLKFHLPEVGFHLLSIKQ